MPDSANFGREAQRVISAVAHWTPARWRIPGPSGHDRAAAVARLVQTLADLGAAAEHRPPKTVPRLANDAVLPDQLRVVAADLIAAEPGAELLAKADAAIKDARAVLF